ncbi:hypothetical protein GGD57_001643 [Rhizobium esperanzae]|uniref:Uncharacterized protein n=1 Tax=Rhizobium esperanzae TaxID=1967781 RepID=A0A7W6R1I1_9HYPH|nr:hypothetical protein [Rhizobium esperanzae]
MTTNPDAGMWPPDPFSWWPVILACLLIIAICYF